MDRRRAQALQEEERRRQEMEEESSYGSEYDSEGDASELSYVSGTPWYAIDPEANA